MRPYRVLKFETLVKEVIRTFEKELINPFSVNTDSTNLFVWSSGVTVADDVAISMLSVKMEGERLENIPKREDIQQNNAVPCSIKEVEGNFESFILKN